MFFFFKLKTAYLMRLSDWSSDVCSSDLIAVLQAGLHASDKRTAICREIHDRHFPKLQLFKQVDAGALGICFPLGCLIAEREATHRLALQGLVDALAHRII